MRAEYKIFTAVAVFLFAAAALYGGWTAGESPRVEWIGFVALILAGLLCAMCGGFFWFVSRRIDLRPEDRADAEVSEGAGEVGFFSPGSYWPFGLALSAAVAAMGLVYWLWWLIAAGLIAVIFAACGLLFEYYSGTRRTAEH
jgi:CDP-diglyceride synthetase